MRRCGAVNELTDLQVSEGIAGLWSGTKPSWLQNQCKTKMKISRRRVGLALSAWFSFRGHGEESGNRSNRSTILREDLLMELPDLRLLVSKRPDLDERIKLSICVIDLSGGLRDDLDSVRVKVDCDSNLRSVMNKAGESHRELRFMRLFLRDRILQFRKTDDCGRGFTEETFWTTPISPGDVIAFCARGY